MPLYIDLSLFCYISVLVRCGWDTNYHGRNYLCLGHEFVKYDEHLALRRHGGFAKYWRK